MERPDHSLLSQASTPHPSARWLAAARLGGQGLGRTYAAIYFAQAPHLGWLFLGATLLYPNVGLAGLWAVACGAGLSQLLQLVPRHRNLYLYNSLLVGLSLGASYQFGFTLALLILMGSALAVLVSALSLDALWRWDRLSPLSLPFVVAALIMAAVAQGLPTLAPYHFGQLHGFGALAAWLQEWPPFVQQYLTALGAVFFVPQPLAGLLIALGLTGLSRYLSLLALTGFAVGATCYQFLTATTELQPANPMGFNVILTTLALGGIFTVPGMAGTALALAAAALCALLTVALQKLLLVYGLPVLALPFLLTTLGLLAVLNRRTQNRWPELILTQPDLPERSYERARLARYRGALAGVPQLRMPVQGQWMLYQGFHGRHTHQAPWQYALDFYQTRDGRSFKNEGDQLEDYYCFNQPVYAPVAGHVVALVDHWPDNAPGQVDSVNNWGNYLFIRTPDGYYILLAHLRQQSMQVASGAYVLPGQMLALCGNSGRSPQPHLHLHVQLSAIPGQATIPFRLCHGLTPKAQPDEWATGGQYHLSWVPAEGELVQSAQPSPALAQCLSLSVGRMFEYHVEADGPAPRRLQLSVEIDLAGELRLVSSSGASAALVQNGLLLSFYDRRGPRDRWFDLWLLALGVTPMEAGSLKWQDSPCAALLQSFEAPWQSWLQPLLPTGLDSHYQRTPQNQGWMQQGQHRANRNWPRSELMTRAWIDPQRGVTALEACREPQRLGRLVLAAVGQRSDQGIPAWRCELEPGTELEHQPSQG